MRMLLIPTLFTLLTATTALATPSLEKVASFNHQVTGVSVSDQGRIFVNFPRWTEDAPISVAELDGKGGLTPYPNAEWNAWRNEKKDQLSPKDHFVCVQSVVADTHGHLWVVDAAAPGNERIVKNGPKLVGIDLTTNAVDRTIPFDETAAPEGTYLNDVRISPDGKTAYLTDSGRGAILVVDIARGTVRRLLEGNPSVMPEKGVAVHADGKELRRPDGRKPEFAADGIALSTDGSYLYWQALSGKTLYRILTSALADASLAPDALAAKVEKIGTNGVADGLWIDHQDHMYITAPEQNALLQRDGKNTPTVLVQDARLRWPDTFSQAPDGTLYVTTSHIQDSPWFKPGAPKEVKTELWKLHPEAN